MVSKISVSGHLELSPWTYDGTTGHGGSTGLNLMVVEKKQGKGWMELGPNIAFESMCPVTSLQETQPSVSPC